MTWVGSFGRLAFTLCLAWRATSSCSSSSPVDMRTDRKGELQEGTAARTGDAVVTIEQVRQMMKTTGVTAEQARSRLVFDALMAEGAKARGFDRHGEVLARRRSVLARAFIETMRKEAASKPITDEDVRAFTLRHWLDMDRPVARKTTHAVVMPKDPKDEAQMAEAEAVALRIANAVRGESDPKAFRDKAKAADSNGIEVLVQDLPPVTKEGIVADLVERPAPGAPPSQFDVSFSKGVFEIAGVGEQSKPVRSKFGVHVILLTAIQEEKRIPFEERRKMLMQEIRAAQVATKVDKVVEGLRQRTPTTVSRNADTILQLIRSPSTSEGP